MALKENSLTVPKIDLLSSGFIHQQSNFTEIYNMTDNQNTQPTQTEVSSQPDTQAKSPTSVPNEAKNLGLFAAGGALAAPFVGMGFIAGAVVGTAAYGVKKALFDSSVTTDYPNQPSTIAKVTNTVSNVASQTVDTVSAWAGEASSWIDQKVKGATGSSDGNAAKKA